MKIRLFLSTGMVGSKREEVMEISDLETEDMDAEQREEYLHEIATDWMNNYIDYGFEVLDA